MGTTADKLQNILNAKEAIRSKFNLPDDLPFIQYADNINTGTSPSPDIPATGDTTFYKCSERHNKVGHNAEVYDLWGALWIFNASGEFAKCNGIWYLVSDEGYERVWHHEKENMKIEYKNNHWIIFDGDEEFIRHGQSCEQPYSVFASWAGDMVVTRYPFFNLISYNNFSSSDVSTSTWPAHTYSPHLVYDLSDPMGYYWEGRTSGSGSVWYNGISFKWHEGKWYFSVNGQYRVYTDEPMPFRKDGSSVVWRNVAGTVQGTTEGKNILPGVWDFDCLVVTSSVEDAGIYYPFSEGEFVNRENCTFTLGHVPVEPPYVMAGADGYPVLVESGGGVESPDICYSWGQNNPKIYNVLFDGKVELPNNSKKVKLQYWEYGTTNWTKYDEETGESHSFLCTDLRSTNYITSMGTEVCRGSYRPITLLKTLIWDIGDDREYWTSEDGKIFRKGDYIMAYGDWRYSTPAIPPTSGKTWFICNAENFNPTGITENPIWQGPPVFFAPYSVNDYGTENVIKTWFMLGYTGNAPTAGVVPLEPLCEYRDYVVVENCNRAMLNGVYKKYVDAESSRISYIKGLDSNKIYLLNIDGVWTFAGSSDGSGVVASQTEPCVDLPSSCAPYALAGETTDLDILTSVHVRYGTVGEYSEYYEGEDSWDGFLATLNEDGTYSFSDEVTRGLPYAEEGFPPIVGNTYSSDLKIQAEQLFGPDAGKYFLCSYVNRNYLSYDKIVVSGIPENAFVGGKYYDESYTQQDLPEDVANRNPNGVYTLTTKGDERYPSTWVWQSENGCILKGHSRESGFQIIPGECNDLNRYIYFVDYNNLEYPSKGYSSYTWTWYDGSNYPTIQGGTVAPQKPAPVEQYWEGYKLKQNNSGKWDITADKVKLIYGDYMPVTGRIYDIAATMEIGNVDLSEENMWACPRNMSSNENDEWKISTDVTIYDNGWEWYAFDSNVSTLFRSATTSSETYLQWQNKIRPVMLKEINIDIGGGYSVNLTVRGSTDGEHWEDIAGAWQSNGYWAGSSNTKYTFETSSDNPPYFYYRLVLPSNSGWNIHRCEAFSQKSRVVPE